MKSKITYCDKELIIEDVHRTICVNYSQIAVISTDKPYIQIITIDKKKIIFEGTLSEIMENLPGFFFHCNRSAIVNLLYVTVYEKNDNCYKIYISAINQTVKVAAKHKDVFNRKLVEIKTKTALSPLCSFCQKAFSNKYNEK